MTEIQKHLNGLSPNFMKNAAVIWKHVYDNRHYNLFVKDSANLDSFKSKTEQCRCLNTHPPYAKLIYRILVIYKVEFFS